MNKRLRICFVSSIPITLWSFYRDLIADLVKEGWQVAICSSPDPQLDIFKKQLQTDIHGIRIPRQITPFQDTVALFRLWNLFRKTKIPIVHAHTPKAGLLAMCAAAMARVPGRLYTCHGLAFETERGLKRLLLILSERLTCRLAHQVLVVSPSLSKRMADFRIGSESKKKILGEGTACGLDVKIFDRTPELESQSRRMRETMDIPAEAVVIGFIGRLVPDKGIHLLVKAFSDLYRDNPQVRLLVIGDCEPHRGLLPDETVRLLQEHPGIRRVGFTHEIQRYYACMDVLVLPTRREGFPYTLLEAAAMRIPVVASKVTGCVDAVVDGVTGLLIEPEHAPALLTAMRTLVSDPARRNAMGQAARKRVEDKYRIEIMIDHHKRLYTHFIGCANSPPRNGAASGSV